MKIGISLCGISHLVDSHRPYSRTYKDSYENFYTELHKPIAKNNSVQTYVTTYYSTEIDNILRIYNPIKFQIYNFNKSHQILTFIKSLEQLRGEELDVIVCTRFDVQINEGALKKLDFNYSKFNFLFRELGYWDSNMFVSDCMYIFPYSMLENVIRACLNLYNNPPRPGLTDMHGLYKCLCEILSPQSLNIACDEHMLSHENNIYKLIRL